MTYRGLSLNFDWVWKLYIRFTRSISIPTVTLTTFIATATSIKSNFTSIEVYTNCHSHWHIDSSNSRILPLLICFFNDIRCYWRIFVYDILALVTVTFLLLNQFDNVTLMLIVWFRTVTLHILSLTNIRLLLTLMTLTFCHLILCHYQINVTSTSKWANVR